MFGHCSTVSTQWRIQLPGVVEYHQVNCEQSLEKPILTPWLGTCTSTSLPAAWLFLFSLDGSPSVCNDTLMLLTLPILDHFASDSLLSMHSLTQGGNVLKAAWNWIVWNCVIEITLLLNSLLNLVIPRWSFIMQWVVRLMLHEPSSNQIILVHVSQTGLCS